MAAVCRCFPGKNPRGGDRVPDPTEIANCARWLDEEIRLLRPRLLIPSASWRSAGSCPSPGWTR